MGPLLRFVHSLDPKRGMRYAMVAELSSLHSSETVQIRFQQRALGPQAFILGSSERVHLREKSLRSRHIAIICQPCSSGVTLRVIALHPDLAFTALPVRLLKEGSFTGPTLPSQKKHTGPKTPLLGGIVAHGQAEVHFNDFKLRVHAQLEQHEPSCEHDGILQCLPMGEQLAFQSLEPNKNIGAPVSSFCGPGGHAIPALMQSSLEGAPLTGSLRLENSKGMHEVHPSQDELRQGLLIGRSRRCVLGQGFDENDGLSRVHALVMRLGKHVYAFDLASRYGLRDISRPNKLVASAKLEERAGVLVYGAGHLHFNTGL